MNLIAEIYEHSTAIQLRQMRDLADQKRMEKLEEAKQQVIAEMREKCEQLDLDFNEVIRINRPQRKPRKSGSILPPKYKSPAGETWSGRGSPPRWIRFLEAEGGNREEYLIKDEA